MMKAIASRHDSVAGVSGELWSAGFDAVVIVSSSLEMVALNPIAEKLLQSLMPQTPGPELKFLSFLRKRGIFTHVPSFDNEIQFEDRWLLVNILQAEGGSFVVVIKDISETKALETQLVALKAANNELNEIIELSADGLVSLDHTGMILRMNKAYEKIVGIKAEDYLGKPAKLIQERGHLPDLVSKYVLKDLKPKNIFVKLKDKEVLLTGRPVFNEEGALIRVVANIRDLTELNHLKNTLKDYHELTHRYEAEIQRLRAREFETEIVGHSSETQRSLELAIQASMVDSTALICGETGTGKELFAKTIHKLSKRANGPFIAINCSALPETLLESEIFGYERGAFTGAHKEGKIGLFEAAQGGTLFLDEISEIPPAMQVKLLRVIQDKKLRRLGSHQEKEIDIRIIAASNKDLKEQIRAGRFREDLYYRLNVIKIVIPLLRDRKEDIPLLAAHFLEKFNKKFNRQKKLTPQTLSMLVAYDWPGNVRELENVIERFVVLSDDLLLESSVMAGEVGVERMLGADLPGLRHLLESAEKDIILNAYRECGSTRRMAQKLGISQATIVRKLKKHKEARPERTPGGKEKRPVGKK
jgi:PAS domain S-box-containing protein